MLVLVLLLLLRLLLVLVLVLVLLLRLLLLLVLVLVLLVLVLVLLVLLVLVLLVLLVLVLQAVHEGGLVVCATVMGRHKKTTPRGQGRPSQRGAGHLQGGWQRQLCGKAAGVAASRASRLAPVGEGCC